MSTIYVLIEPHTEEIRYVGWTSKKLTERLKGHLRETRPCRRKWWLLSLRKVGLAPRIQKVQDVPLDQWREAERYWIQHFREIGCPLVNGTDGGEGIPGHKHSPETKRKLSVASKKQFKDPEARAAVSKVHSGKEISEGHREVVRKANKRRWAKWRDEGGVISEETRAKISAARKGKPMSAGARAKISAYQKGRPKSPEHRAKLAEANRRRAREKKKETLS